MNRDTWWRALGGPHAISWVSVVLSAGLALASAIWTVRNYPVSVSETLVGQSGGFIALLTVLVLARFTWLRPTRHADPRPWAVLGTFALASAARVAVVGGVAVATDEWGQWPAEQTLIFGFMGQVVLLAIVSIAVNTVRASAESIKRLEAARETVERARTLTEEEVALSERQFVEQILESVQSSLNSVSDTADHTKLVDEVRRTAVEVVRPASHELHSGAIAQQTVQASAPRIHLRDVLRDVRPVAPLAGPVSYEFLVFGSLWGALGASAAVVNFFVGTTVLITANVILGIIWRKTSWHRARIVALTLGYVLGNLAALLVVIAVVSPLTDRAETLWIGLGIYPGFMLLISIVSSLARQRLRLQVELDEALEAEAHALARVSTLAAEQRLRLTRLMHGGLQADLIAAAKIFESDTPVGSTGRTEPLSLRALTDEIRQRYASLDAPGHDQDLVDLVETWQLATDVELDLDARAAQALEADLRLRSQVVSIVSEALTNAVRHGSGSTIYVNVTEGSAVLSIDVTHHGELGSTDRGLGLTAIDSAADSWDLHQEADEVVLHAEVIREK